MTSVELWPLESAMFHHLVTLVVFPGSFHLLQIEFIVSVLVSFFPLFGGFLLHLLGNCDTMLLGEGLSTSSSFIGSDGLITSGELIMYPMSNLVELCLG